MLQYHNHYDSSVLDGSSRIEDAIKRAKELGYTSLGMTDHGTGQGLFRFYKKCTEAGIKPVLGAELYMGEKDSEKRHHIIVLAKNNAGLKNLFNLITRAYMENFYYKPRVTTDMLREHSEGLIATSACLGSKMGDIYRNGTADDGRVFIREMHSIFGVNGFFLELQPNAMKEQVEYNTWLVTNFPYAQFTVNSDMHYVLKEDATTHDTLLAMQVKKKKADKCRFKFQGEDYYMMSEEEINEKLSYISSDILWKAIANTERIANECNVTIETGNSYLPHIPNDKAKLAELCNVGFRKRMEEGKFNGIEIQKVIERIKYELSVICEKGFATYFLMVSDYIHWAEANDVYVGAGRGSVCGSIVAYIIGIHQVEPISNGLLFERFQNPERSSIPDIDLDFDYEDRHRIIQYIKEKYGAESVAHIIAEGRFTLKNALRSVMRSYEYTEQYINAIGKTIPDSAETFEDAFKSPEFSEKIGQIIPDALADMIKIEGLVSTNSKHAAGVVITPGRVYDMIPCMRDSDDPTMLMTQWDKKQIEEVGAVKFDILGLKLLTIFKKTLAHINLGKNTAVLTREELTNINLGDPKIYEVLCSGNMYGMFQFEGSSAKAVVNKVKPKNFNDVIACESICRPGVKDSDLYISNKQLFDESGAYPVPEYWNKIKHILEETYGAIVYQEQTMLLFNEIGGFTLGEADKLRKVKSLEPYREKFVNNAVLIHSFTTDEANKLFDRFDLNYSFNKSHAAAYALNTVQCAYLKAYYPAEFMSAVLSLELTKQAPAVKEIIQECRNAGITICPPRINLSRSDFRPDGHSRILMPLTSIAGIGDSVIEEIERCNGFDSFDSFIKTVQKKKINKAKVVNLIKAGVFDEFEITLGHSRSQTLQGYYNSIKEKIEVPFWCDEVRMGFEKEVYGFYLTRHPLDGQINLNIAEIPDGNSVTINAIINQIRYNKDRNGNTMAFADCENKNCTFDTIVFARQFENKRTQAILIEGNIVKITGKVDGGKILLNSIDTL